MNRRSSLKLIASFAFFFASGLASAQGQAPAFTNINPQQQGGSNGQIEVLEFFSYGCPHCFNFDPFLTKWAAEQKKDIALSRVPVSFGRPEWQSLGRLYITLKAMGLNEKLDPLVFKAIHNDRVKLHDEKTRNDWLAKQGVDVKKFNDTWRSFGVDSQAKRAEQLAANYRIQGVPSMAVNGRFLVEGEGEQSLKTVDELIQRIRSGK